MLSIRPATIKDVPLLKTLIHELAVYDRLDTEAAVTEEDIKRDGFGPSPKFRVVIAEFDGQLERLTNFRVELTPAAPSLKQMKIRGIAANGSKRARR